MTDGRIDGYLVQAANCVRLAQITEDPARKLSLLDLARAWVAIAEQGDRNRQTTIVYHETPAARSK
jgi:hypothetical protein